MLWTDFSTCFHLLYPTPTLTPMINLTSTLTNPNASSAQVTEETEAMRFNTGISAMMEFVNGATKWPDRPRAALEPFALLLSPYAPHLAEELWQVRNSTSLPGFWFPSLLQPAFSQLFTGPSSTSQVTFLVWIPFCRGCLAGWCQCCWLRREILCLKQGTMCWRVGPEPARFTLLVGEDDCVVACTRNALGVVCSRN